MKKVNIFSDSLTHVGQRYIRRDSKPVDTEELTPTQLKFEKARIATRTVVDKVWIEQLELELNEWNNGARSRELNLTKQLRFVPKFCEEVDNYFQQF